jgi:hypothetical protein
VTVPVIVGEFGHRLVLAVLIVLSLTTMCATRGARAQEERQEYVRVTFYVLRGAMASGIVTHHGAAACSYGFPMGTILEMPDGWEVTCLDRGHLGRDTGWVDIWAPSLAWGRRYVAQDYGNYAWVRVKRWGYAWE